jgi:von Willebrand factor type A domain
VSGSMGNDQTRFAQKWSPVIAAAKAFFAEPESAAISASMTFFPVASAATRCTDAAYAAPDVPQTALPSTAFAAAIDGLNLTANGTWRSSTPTLHAFNGVVGGVQSVGATAVSETRAVVLVTDGVPQNCSAQANDVANVATAVANSGVRTFVIGVDNPPGLGPANLDNLNAIAVAGGTERAFVVATGDPAQTEADFRAVIDSIRGSALSCSIEIPLPPTGSTFVPEQVNVTYTSAGASDVLLDYDPDCSTPSGWHYNDPNQPVSIILCSDACGTVQNDVSARLSVEFGCARRSAPR